MSDVEKKNDDSVAAEVEETETLKSIKVKVKSGQAWTRFLEIELAAEDVNASYESTYEEFRKKAKIPGFRPGKAPIGLVRQRYADDVRQDVLETLLPKAYEQALEQEKLIPLSPLKLSDVELGEGKPLRFKAEIEIRPEVKLGKYTGFRVEKTIASVADKELDNALTTLRERFAEFFPVQRPVENGDMVIVDLLKKHDKLKRLKEDKLENVEVELDSRYTLEEFQRGLVGMKMGEMKDISVKYPDNYFDTNLAGDQILYLVVVKEVKKKVLPELNDEFAGKVSKSKTLAELKDKVRQSLERQAEDDATRIMRNGIIKRVVDANRFDVPISLLDKYLDSVVQDFKKKGEPFEEGSVRRQYRSFGEDLIRWSFLYYEIARAENIQVQPEDRIKWVERFARTYNMSVEEARQALGKSRRLADIDDSILEEKVLQFVITNSEIITTK
jgi:trigger factor